MVAFWVYHINLITNGKFSLPFSTEILRKENLVIDKWIINPLVNSPEAMGSHHLYWVNQRTK
jgi:hypothetical protein